MTSTLAATPATAMPPFPRSVALLGCTGSIGTQAAQVVAEHASTFTVEALACGGSDLDQLGEQVVRLRPRFVGVARGAERDVRDAILAAAERTGEPTPDVEVAVGPDAATRAASLGVDVVLNGITGAVGLRPTLAALEAGSVLALANKESLIVGAPLVHAVAAPGQIVPVDSEHSAIAQCLAAGRAQDVRRLVITASGGPFRGRSPEELHAVTPQEALRHPTWDMGRVITTNSATLVNKGLEVIEAHHLFSVPFDRIEVVVHPQSVVHSMVEFTDGSTLAKVSPPSMLIPIGLGLSWPERLADVDTPCDWSAASTWTFEPLDRAAFPAVDLAYEVGRAGGTSPAVYNAANEVCVDAFHDRVIRFTDIVPTIAKVVAEHGGGTAATVEDVLEADSWARARARAILGGTSARAEV